MQFRQARLKKGLQRHLNQWLMHEAVCYGVPTVNLTHIVVSNDLSYIKVYVHQPNLDRSKPALIKDLNTLAPQLRHFVSQRVCLKYIPRFRFYYDDQEDTFHALQSVINSIEAPVVVAESDREGV